MTTRFKSLTLSLLAVIAILGFVPLVHAADPDLQFDSFAVVADDGDSKIEPNECVDVNITLINNGATVDATGVTADLVSDTAGVTAVLPNDSSVSYGTITAGGGTATNATAFRISVSPAFLCDVPIDLTLNVHTDQGDFAVPVQLPTGSVPPVSDGPYSASPNRKIHDGKGQASSTIAVPTVSTVVKVTASVYITHDDDVDLTLTLVGPDGTSVDLSSLNGNCGSNYGSSSSNTTTFDDDAANSITTGTSACIGTFQPEGLLASFAGKATNGNWILRVKDTANNHTGNFDGKINFWSISFQEPGACSDGGVCSTGSQPDVVFSSATVIDPTDNAIDVNDCFDMNVALRNDGTADATAISGATLSTTTPGVTIIQGTSDYATIVPGATITDTTNFQVEVSPDVPCGTVIDFLLTGTTVSSIPPTTPIPFAIHFKQTVGTLNNAAAGSDATAVGDIPDNDPAGITSAVGLSSILGTVGKVTVDVNISHDSDSDLTLSLIGPDSTEVVLANGVVGVDYGLDCTQPTTFDDGASTVITSGTAPFTGSFGPENPLSAFAGKDPNGSWTLKVVDNVNGTTGTLQCWALHVTTCADGGCCPTITLDDNLLDGNVGDSLTQVQASGGTGPYTYAVTSGTVPSGVTLNSDGTFSGNFTHSGTFDFTVTATDAHGCKGSQAYEVVVSCVATITLDTLSDGTINVPYDDTILADGGAGGYTFAQLDGTLPTGLTLETDGQLHGTPTETGDFTFTVEATDSAGCSGSQEYTVHITCPTITLTPDAGTGLPTGTEGAAYSQQITASGGSGNYTFTTSDTLPNGIQLDSDGLLHGTPTEHGSFPITVTATDADTNCTGEVDYTLNINAATCPTITVTPSSIPNAQLNQLYSGATFDAFGSGPDAIYTFTLDSGSLPTGIGFDTDNISGTPTAHGSFTFTIKATDLDNCFGTRTYTLISCVFCDDFEDGNFTTPTWAPKNGTWTMVGGGPFLLNGKTNSNGKSVINPPSVTGLASIIQRTLELDGVKINTTNARVAVNVYRKDRRHYVKMTFDQKAQAISLKQKNGRKSRSLKILVPIVVGTGYDIKIVYTGTGFQIFIDNVLKGTMPQAGVPAGAANSWSVLFSAANAQAQLDSWMIY